MGADGLDGVTVSVGEPFDQPAALEALLRGQGGWHERRKLKFDIPSCCEAVH